MEYASKSRGGVCSHREIGAVAEDHVAGRPIDSSTAFAAFAAGTAAPAAASISAAADCPASTAATSADAPALFCTLRPDRAVSADVIPRPDKRGPAQRPNGPTAQRPNGPTAQRPNGPGGMVGGGGEAHSSTAPASSSVSIASRRPARAAKCRAVLPWLLAALHRPTHTDGELHSPTA